MSVKRSKRGLGLAAASIASLLVLSACGGDDEGGDSGGGGDDGGATTLSFANSYPDEHPHNTCGAQVVADELAEGGTGVEIEIFSNSQLGPDAERFASVASGDIDLDIQGASAISASFPEVGALDAAYAFDGPDALFEFVDSEEFEGLKERNLPEVQSHVSLTGHQVGSVLAIISEDTWQSLSAEQQEAVQAAISDTRDGDRQCVEDAETEIIEEWKSTGDMTVVEDVDLDTFRSQAEEFFMSNYEGE